jgi:hypothetical protein
MDHRIKTRETTHYELIDASAVLIKENLLPARFVIRMDESEFLVQKETFSIESSMLKHLSFAETEHFCFGDRSVPAGCVQRTKDQALLDAGLRFNQRIQSFFQQTSS